MINIMRFKHLKTIPPPLRSWGKIVFHKMGPWCQEGGEPLFQRTEAIEKPESCPRLYLKFPPKGNVRVCQEIIAKAERKGGDFHASL